MGVFHRYLTDKEYIFCKYYIFGLPIDNIGEILGGGLVEPIKNPFRPLNYRKPDNSLKYCFDNATGSYYKAFGCKYSSAKTSAHRLLKDYRVKEELALMGFYITRLGYSRLEAGRHYISPNALGYTKAELWKSWKVSPEELKTGKLKEKIENKMR